MNDERVYEDDELEAERKEALEALFEEVQEKFGDQHEVYEKAEEEFSELLVDLQTVVGVGLENKALLITEDSNINIAAVVDKITECKFLKIFEQVENSPVTVSAGVAIALWQTTSCALSELLSMEDIDLASEEVINSTPVLHIVSSVLAVYELLCHCLSFANFEATIDQEEYGKLYMRMQDLMGFGPGVVCFGLDDEE